MLRFGSPIPHKRSRIEIIPLIDIMFFLLAAFMMVSLQLSRSENVRVALPEASGARADYQPDQFNITVDRTGRVYVQRREVGVGELSAMVSNRFRVQPDTPVLICGDLATEHRMMASVYAVVRSLGAQRVSFGVVAPTPGASGTQP